MEPVTNPPTCDAGYWLLYYPDYEQRLAAMATYVAAMLHPRNSPTAPLAKLALTPIPASR